MVLRVGLTGGIGSGKSTVAHIFTVLGIPVFDADTVAKNVMNEDEELKKKIIDVFGEQAYTGNQLNRKYIASIVFSDAWKLEQLNAIVHPATIAAAEQWMRWQTSPYAVKEAALLFESGSAAGTDVVVGVFAPQALRIQRVMERDNVNREEVMKRISNQIDDEIKKKLCDFVLINDEQQLLLPQVITLHEQLLQLAKQRNNE
ncbi:MAG TPA: dephospho-CoA kinase [Chitinophagaceae bacterium]|nr:dephospho-CoA kinase [Chitinophagaceae bacterium]